jgi:hypothetical protein
LSGTVGREVECPPGRDLQRVPAPVETIPAGAVPVA